MAENVKKKRGRIIAIIFLTVAAVFLGVHCLHSWRALGENDAKIVMYEGPASLRDAAPEDLAVTNELERDFKLLHCTDTKVSVNGAACYVYDTNVNNSRQWQPELLFDIGRTPVTYFDFDGTITVKVTTPGRNPESVTVRPLAYGIEPQISGDTVTFQISEPDSYTVEFNGSYERAVHIFANPIETDIPTPQSDGVIYIGPGEWNIEQIEVKSGQTLYIAGGAVVHGTIFTGNAENVTIRGRGIIDGSVYRGDLQRTVRVPVNIYASKHVTVEGLVLLNPNGWAFQMNGSEDVTAENIKIVSCRANGDGFTIQSCNNINVRDSFVRSWDDSLVVKCYSTGCKDILFKNVQIWTDLAQSMEIGYETNKGNNKDISIENVTFEDITVLHNFHKPVISIHNADEALVKNITYRNITVEDAQMGGGDAFGSGQLIDIRVLRDPTWTTTANRGKIQNVLIENVNVISHPAPISCMILGYDSDHNVDGVDIRNVTVNGKKLSSEKDFGLYTESLTVSGVKIS